MRKILMECVGTFFFLLTIAVGANPLAIAAMFMAWLYIGAYVSGANYNPMITVAFALREKISWGLAGYYIVAQVLGGLLAFAIPSYLGYEVTLPEPGMGVNLFQAFVVEVLLAFVLALVTLAVTTAEKYRTSNIFGFAIGFTIPALVTIGAPISGGLFNPALAMGGALFGTMSRMHMIVWKNLFMYVIGAFLGGILAAYAYDYFFEPRR